MKEVFQTALNLFYYQYFTPFFDYVPWLLLLWFIHFVLVLCRVDERNHKEFLSWINWWPVVNAFWSYFVITFPFKFFLRCSEMGTFEGNIISVIGYIVVPAIIILYFRSADRRARKKYEEFLKEKKQKEEVNEKHL